MVLLGLTIGKSDSQFEKTTRPNRTVLSRYSTFPVLDVENTLFGALGLGIETERMVSSPLLPAWVSAWSEVNTS